MQEIPLDKIPFQEVGITLNDVVYHITLKQGRTGMFISIRGEEEDYISGCPLVANIPLLTRKDQSKNGNFTFLSKKDDFTYKDLGEDCILVFE